MAHWVHGTPFPKIHCILDWDQGGDFVASPEGLGNEEKSHRKSPTFLYNSEQKGGVMKVIRECKQLDKRGILGQVSQAWSGL